MPSFGQFLVWNNSLKNCSIYTVIHSAKMSNNLVAVNHWGIAENPRKNYLLKLLKIPFKITSRSTLSGAIIGGAQFPSAIDESGTTFATILIVKSNDAYGGSSNVTKIEIGWRKWCQKRVNIDGKWVNGSRGCQQII